MVIRTKINTQKERCVLYVNPKANQTICARLFLVERSHVLERTVHGTCAQVLRSQGAYKCPVCRENELNFLQTKTAGKLTNDDVNFIFSEIFKEEDK